MRADQILRRPIVLTEKANRLRDRNQIVFEVSRDANKVQIKNAVQEMFKVTVQAVNTSIVRGRDRRMGRGFAKTQNWKKAVVTLKEGSTIDFFAETE